VVCEAKVILGQGKRKWRGINQRLLGYRRKEGRKKRRCSWFVEARVMGTNGRNRNEKSEAYVQRTWLERWKRY